MGATVTTADAYLKEVYSDQRIADETAQQCPTLGRIREKKDFTGKRYVIPVTYSGNEAFAPSSQTSSITAGNMGAEDFLLTRKGFVAKVKLDFELFESAKKDRGAFVDALEHEVEGKRSRFAAGLGEMLFRNGGGAIGRIASGQTGQTVTLTDAKDAVGIRPGMILRTSTADGNSGALKAGGVTVASVNYVAGTVTISEATWDANPSGIPTVAANDYLFPCPSKTTAGTFGGGMAGFEAWCPATDPTGGDSFYGVDRSVAVNELAGLRKTASGGSVEGAIVDACVEAARLGRRFKQVILNPYLVGTLLKELGSKVVYQGNSDKMTIGASSIMLRVPVMDGVIEVVSDPYCQSNIGWLVDLADWAKLTTPSGFIFIQKDPRSGTMCQWSADDAFEMRMAVYGNFGTYNPGNIMRLAFA